MNTSTLTTDLKDYFNKLKLQESYASIVLGAIVVIILGLLIANYFTKGSGQIGTGLSTTQEAQQITQPNRTYKVAAGDSLSKISDKVYGDMQYWPVLARANNIGNPDVIYADAQLTIPAKADAFKMHAEMTMTSYQVHNGDTLFIIAQKAYGDGSRWQEIANVNNVGYLPNGNPLIFAGSQLTIPR
jgi:nucleoid-associated protein YgaU